MNGDELFMLIPAELAPHGNQFRRVVHADERLEAVRTLTGSTSVITRARPIVFVEGEPRTSKTDSDQSLLGLLVPESASWVVVPARGRSEAIRHARQLQDTLGIELPGLPVFALVDADREAPDDETIVAWPASMIENLLLDPWAIWNLLEPYANRVPFDGEEAVADALSRIAQSQRDDEIRLRVQDQLGRLVLNPSLSSDGDQLRLNVDDLSSSAQIFLDDVSSRASALIEAATAEVDQILQDGRHLERFRGKQLLNAFYADSHLGGIFSKQAFIIEVARRAASGDRIRALVAGPVARIQRYVPRRIVEILDEMTVGADVLAQARALASEAILAWENPSRDAVDLDLLRTLTHQVIRIARDNGEDSLADELAVLVPRFGLAR
jgi:hypothetical protein